MNRMWRLCFLAAVSLGSLASSVATAVGGTGPISEGCIDYIELGGDVYVRAGFRSSEPLTLVTIEEPDGSYSTLVLKETAPGFYTAWNQMFSGSDGAGTATIREVTAASGATYAPSSFGALPATNPGAPVCGPAATAEVPGGQAGPTATTAPTTTMPSTSPGTSEGGSNTGLVVGVVFGAAVVGAAILSLVGRRKARFERAGDKIERGGRRVGRGLGKVWRGVKRIFGAG